MNTKKSALRGGFENAFLSFDRKVPVWPSCIMTDYIQSAAKEAKIEKHIHWHGFRHASGSLLKANGEDGARLNETRQQPDRDGCLRSSDSRRCAFGTWACR
jgi:site-specific recombinase XerD